MHRHISDNHLLLAAYLCSLLSFTFNTFTTLAIDKLLFFLLDWFIFNTRGFVRYGCLESSKVDEINELVDVLPSFLAFSCPAPFIWT